ncbi:short-subunit dehydrogenase [Roseiarcus fermentans]|uniref:Short-subunit dehydrogenase n=1 Tax=Roseiarcus fermentans TaxID=1473586 RepID=A0A366EM71_9HYPH|nr:SDR family oxidoreductase [Roseiarcus fermentans]RBP02820.1 short-subunit dehydrogenase [Roseiarcus fermentans]
MGRSRTVFITGATAGVGRAVARRFAGAGDRVGILARDPEALEEVRRELAVLGAEAACESVDVADADAVFAAAARLEDTLGPVDVWINDAMETVFSRVADISPAEFQRVTDVTYLGFVHGTMAALKSMRPRGQGRIVQMGSALAYRGIPLQAAYCGAKHAIRGFTDSLRAELLAEGSQITVTIVELPAVNTPQFDWARAHLGRTPRPMGRPVEPEAVADAVYRATAGRWREYWLGWPTILLILGDFVLPGALDRYLAGAAIEGQQTKTPIAHDRPDNLDHPVTSLHRVRGSFGREAETHAPLVVGELARLGAVAAGALVFFAAGALVMARRGARRRLQAAD